MDLKLLFKSAKGIIESIEPTCKDIRLEAAEVTDEFMNIVVSYLLEDTNKPIINSPLTALAGLQNSRQYERVFKELVFTKNFELKKISIYKS